MRGTHENSEAHGRGEKRQGKRRGKVGEVLGPPKRGKSVRKANK